MGIHVLQKPIGDTFLFFCFFLLIFSGCATEEKSLILSKRIDAVAAKTDKALISNSERMAANDAELGKLKEEMRFINGRLDENNHLLKRTVERDTIQGDSLSENVSELTERVTQLELCVDRISSYLGLPKIKKKPTEPVEASAPIHQAPPPPPKPMIQPKPKVKIPPEQMLYEINLNNYRKEKYEEAISGFKNFLKKYPKSKLADNAVFWVGESYMALKQYEQAILAYQKVIKKYPEGNKVPNALLRQALAFYELKDKTSSKLLLKKLIKKYPKSSEANIARKKLKTMK